MGVVLDIEFRGHDPYRHTLPRQWRCNNGEDSELMLLCVTWAELRPCALVGHCAVWTKFIINVMPWLAEKGCILTINHSSFRPWTFQPKKSWIWRIKKGKNERFSRSIFVPLIQYICRRLIGLAINIKIYIVSCHTIVDLWIEKICSLGRCWNWL